jgi:hypothetical protein
VDRWVKSAMATRGGAAVVLALSCAAGCSSPIERGTSSSDAATSTGTCSTTGDACESCLGTSCCAEIQDCTGACSSLITCLASCAVGDTSCTDGCDSSYPDGVSGANSILSCGESSCSSACSGTADAGAPTSTATLITVVGDATNGIPESNVTSVTCTPNVHVEFSFPSYGQYAGLTTYVVPGDTENNPRIVVEGGGGLLYWDANPGVTYPTTGSGTIASVTLHSDNSFAPGTVTISGSYSCD